MKVLDKATFLAWLKVERVFAAWTAYPQSPSIKSQIKPVSEKEPIDSFEAWDAVERAINECVEEQRKVRWVRDLCYRAAKNGVLEYSDDSYIPLRDAVIREVARRW